MKLSFAYKIQWKTFEHNRLFKLQNIMLYITNTKFIIVRRFKEINKKNYINNLTYSTLKRKIDIKIT